MSQYANITEPETAIECVVPNGTEKASQSDFKDLLVLSIEYSDFFNVPSKEIPATTIAVDSPSTAIIIGSPSLLTRSASGNVISFPHIIDDIYEAPYSFNDFREYIGKFYAEENLDFLRDIRGYQKIALQVFPADSILDYHDTEAIRDMGTTYAEIAKQSDMKNSTYASILVQLEEIGAEIIANYIGDESPREINILYSTKNKLYLDSASKILHPNIFAESFHHIAKMVHDNFFLKFMKHSLEEGSVTIAPSKDSDSTSVPSTRISNASRSVTSDSQSMISKSSGRSLGRQLLTPRPATKNSEEADKASLSPTASNKSKRVSLSFGRGSKNFDEVIAEPESSDSIASTSNASKSSKPGLIASGRGSRGGRG